jgi:hypothetical protein
MPYGCFSGLHYVVLVWFELCDCLYGTSMLASMSYVLATIRGLSFLVTHSLYPLVCTFNGQAVVSFALNVAPK